jgi:hypothetical protein
VLFKQVGAKWQDLFLRRVLQASKFHDLETFLDRQVSSGLKAIEVFLMRREEKNQLDATEWFIALIICSACFGHFYVHHQELETICVLLPPMVCSAWLLVVGGQMQGSRLCVQAEGCCTTVVVQQHITSDDGFM